MKMELFPMNQCIDMIGMYQCFKTRPGPVGRPGPGTGPGGGKNPLENWPGKTQSTRQVDPGPGPPGQTRMRPGQFFLFWLSLNDVIFCFLKCQNAEDWRVKKNEAKSVT